MSELEPTGAGDFLGEEPVQRKGMFGVTGPGDTSGYGGLVRPLPIVPTSTRPFDESNEDIYSSLERAFPQLGDAVERVVVQHGEMTLYIGREHLLEVAQTLRDAPELRFELLSSVSGVDYLGVDPTGRRLHSVYHLLSMTHRRRVRLEVSVTVEDPHVPSLTAIYPTADWQERETWDFFGIVYDGHHGLTRIMMPDDWDGHPQRKDYPLGGVPVEYKGAEIPPPDQRRSYA
ncbi:MAG TPA: NADH-quinone oxidoreductase subunit C [Frankiaceae bacterium]|nr:NADH-quinone oxidoreductase subunit C [Frankiaceae bacterium]